MSVWALSKAFPWGSSQREQAKTQELSVSPWKKLDYILSYLLPESWASKLPACGSLLGSLLKPEKACGHFPSHTETNYIQTVKSWKGESWKQQTKSDMLHIRKGNTQKTIGRFFSQNITGQKGVGWYFKCWEKKTCQWRLVFLAKLSFRIEEEIKIFPDQQSWINSPPLDWLCKKC